MMNDKTGKKKTLMRRRIYMLTALAIAVLLLAGCGAGKAGSGKYADVVVLSTTDMHGKCWKKDLLMDFDVKSNMLKVSEAVGQTRDEYGKENVILLDNGDGFQGTMISQMQLIGDPKWDPESPPPMALCLKEIGYDAMTLGNHEFDFNWTIMDDTYRYLMENGVDVLASNIVYSEDSEDHKRGDNAFTPYITKTVTVNGHEHRIGILGIENTDVGEWVPESNHPGMQFVHPGNESHDAAYEAGLYLPEMKKEGCEFIIVSYHGGHGSAEGKINTDNQGMNILKNTEDIDMLILGHDHSAGISNTYETDKAGDKVLIVNGGGQELTKSVFRFTENGKGELQYEVVSSENLDLNGYEPDKKLEKLIQPYADRTEEYVNRPVGKASGDWDGNTDVFYSQTQTTDLAGKALISEVSGLYGSAVDLAILSFTTKPGYAVTAGDLTMKDMYKINSYQNSAFLYQLSGKKIRDIMEETASERYTCRVIGGKPRFYTKGDYFTALACFGLNYSIDMSRPEGERVVIEGFPDGRPFDEDAEYLVATTNYLVSNGNCGLRDLTEDDAVWLQIREDPAGVVQDLFADYVRKTSQDGGLTPELFTWKRELTYSADPAAADSGEGKTAAVREETPEEGVSYVLYQEAEGCAMTGRTENDGLAGAEMTASGDRLTGEIPEEVLRFTVKRKADGNLLLTDQNGRYLTCDKSRGIELTEKEAEDHLSEWILKKTDGSYALVSAGNKGTGDQEIAVQYFESRFTNYPYVDRGDYVFNFYRIEE